MQIDKVRDDFRSILDRSVDPGREGGRIPMGNKIKAHGVTGLPYRPEIPTAPHDVTWTTCKNFLVDRDQNDTDYPIKWMTILSRTADGMAHPCLGHGERLVDLARMRGAGLTLTGLVLWFL